MPPALAPGPERDAFGACLARVVGVDPADLPPPAGPDALPALRGWLARRDLGLVAVHEPQHFSWPGFWIGRIRGPRELPPRWAVLFGVPSGVVFDPSGHPLDGPAPAVQAGWVVGLLDPSGPRGAVNATEVAAGLPRAGTVAALYVAPAAGAPMQAVPDVRAGPAGLAGDRYAAGAGTFSDPSVTGTALTLVEAEALEGVILPGGARLAPDQARRNVVTRGIALDALIGRRFLLGEVECLGQRHCQPCAHWQRLTRPGVLRGFVHRGGLRADVVGAGVVRIGDPVRPLD